MMIPKAIACLVGIAPLVIGPKHQDLKTASDVSSMRSQVSDLGSDDVQRRADAFYRLKEFGVLALPILREYLESPNLEIALRVRALINCAEINGKLPPALRRLEPDLADVLAEGDQHSWTTVFIGLMSKYCRTDGNSVLPPISFQVFVGPSVIGSKTELERITICELVRTRGIPNVAHTLICLLNDDCNDVRMEALRTIVEHRSTETSSGLITLLNRADTLRRDLVLIALTELDVKEAIPSIVAQLKNADALIRIRALQALGELRARGTVDSAAQCLYDPEELVQIVAIQTLGKLGGSKAFHEIQRLRNAADSTVSHVAEDTLLQMGLGQLRDDSSHNTMSKPRP